jgi:hypothetical protein
MVFEELNAVLLRQFCGVVQCVPLAEIAEAEDASALLWHLQTLASRVRGTRLLNNPLVVVLVFFVC